MSNYLSFGAGVNSSALAILLVNEGWRGQIVFADTGAEYPDTYCWLDLFERDWLQLRGLHVTRLKGLPWQRKAGGIGLLEYCEQAHVIPLAAVRWCTVEWKVSAIERWAIANGLTLADSLIGIAADESHRQTQARRPLVDRFIGREGCVRIIEAEGLPVPRKSGCFICPFQRDGQWRELWERYPELFERAKRLEELVRRRSAGRFRASLDVAGKSTLRDRELRYRGQAMMDFDGEDLRAYQPCTCGL